MKKIQTYDIFGRTEPSIIYLAKPGKRIFCALNGIDTSTVSLSLNTNNTAELSFTVNKYIDESILSNGYDELEEKMELYCDGIWFKIMDPPTKNNDGTKETKDITAESYEIMLSQYSLNDFNINTGEKDSYEVMYKTTHKDLLIEKLKNNYKKKYITEHPSATDNEIKTALDEYDAEDELENNTFFQIKFYYNQDELKVDPTLEDLSLLHLILKHSGADIVGWHIGYVDSSTNDNFGEDPYPEDSTIPYNNRNILPNYITNYEVDNKSVYTFLTQDVAQACRCVFEFDTMNMTINVYRPETLGVDTGIFLGFRNIQNNVTTSRDDSLITQFYVEGLEDYDVAAVNYASNVMTDLSHFEREPYMDNTLIEKYKAYIKYKEDHRLEYVRYSQCYNAINEKLTELTNRVPVDSVQNTWTDCDMDTLQSAYTSNSAILMGLRALYVDDNNNFDINALKKNKEDWSLYQSIKNYTIPEITAAMQYRISNHHYTEEEMEKWKFFPSGTGNLLSNSNPVILNTSWEMLYPEYANNFELFDVDSSSLPSGITRGIHFIPKTLLDNPSHGRFGITQRKIPIELGETYILSCYIMYDAPSSSGFRGEFQLHCGNIGDDFIVLDSVIDETSNTWQLVKGIIKTGTDKVINSNMINIAFTARLGVKICGMQLEKYNGDNTEISEFNPTFGYYIQPETVLKAYEINWKLYGIDELKVKINTYQNCIDELKKNGFGEGYKYITSAGYKEEYGYQMHQSYCDYIELKKRAESALNQRQAEYDYINEGRKPESADFEFTITDPFKVKIKVFDENGKIKNDDHGNPEYIELDIIDYCNGLSGCLSKRKELIADVDLDNWGKKNFDNILSGSEPFTDEEKQIIQHLYTQASYSNENIIITSIDDTSTSVEKSFQLFNDAKEELYIESHPQYTYSDTIENIYALPEFKLYHDKLNVNDYIYLGLDDEIYVKLRVIKIQYNPMDLNEQMSITFSNSIQYKSRRVDYNNLLNVAMNQSNHDGGSVQGVQKSSDSSSYVISADVVQRLFSNPFFTSKVSNTVTSSSGSISDIDINNVISQFLSSNKEQFNSLDFKCGFIQAIDQNYLTSDLIGKKFITPKNIASLFSKDNFKDITIYNTTFDAANLLNSTFTKLSGGEFICNLYKINTNNPLTIFETAMTDSYETLRLQMYSLENPCIGLKKYTNNTSDISIQADNIILTGDTNISSLSEINNISDAASEKIRDCHTHAEIIEKIELLQTQINDLQNKLNLQTE